jgi:hypothetical protein
MMRVLVMERLNLQVNPDQKEIPRNTDYLPKSVKE